MSIATCHIWFEAKCDKCNKCGTAECCNVVCGYRIKDLPVNEILSQVVTGEYLRHMVLTSICLSCSHEIESPETDVISRCKQDLWLIPMRISQTNACWTGGSPFAFAFMHLADAFILEESNP